MFFEYGWRGFCVKLADFERGLPLARKPGEYRVGGGGAPLDGAIGDGIGAVWCVVTVGSSREMLVPSPNCCGWLRARLTS